MRFRNLAAGLRIEMKTEWDLESAITTYNVDGWGEGYFTVNSAGNVEARPLKDNGGFLHVLGVIQQERTRNPRFSLLILLLNFLPHPAETNNPPPPNPISGVWDLHQYRGV